VVHVCEQILKNHIVPGEVLNTSQLQAQAAPLPTLTGQSLQARPRRSGSVIVMMHRTQLTYIADPTLWLGGRMSPICGLTTQVTWSSAYSLTPQ